MIFYFDDKARIYDIVRYCLFLITSNKKKKIKKIVNF